MGKGQFIDDTSSEEEDEPEQRSPTEMNEEDRQQEELNEELRNAEDMERAVFSDNNYWKNDANDE